MDGVQALGSIERYADITSSWFIRGSGTSRTVHARRLSANETELPLICWRQHSASFGSIR